MTLPAGVAEADLLATIAANSGSSPVDSLTPELNGLVVLANWLRDWCDRNRRPRNPTHSPAIFVLHPKLHEERSSLTAFSDAPQFRTAYTHLIPGKLHITTPQMRTVLRKDHEFPDALSACEWLATSEFARLPTAIFKPDQRRVMLLEQGAAREEQIEVSCDPMPAASSASVKDILYSFHSQYTAHPGGYCDVWETAKERILRTRVEVMIIKNLTAYIKIAYQRVVNALHEVAAPAGRMDICILPRVPKTLDANEMSIVELKVLRSRRSQRRKLKGKVTIQIRPVGEDWNENWALKGVRQVANYVQTMNASEGHLCCFDGRDSDSDLIRGPALAKKGNIGFYRLYMSHHSPEN